MCLKNDSKARKSEKLCPKRLEKSRKMSLENLEITIKMGIKMPGTKCVQNSRKIRLKNTILPACETHNDV